MTNRGGGWSITPFEPAKFSYMCYAGEGCTYPPSTPTDPDFVGDLADLINITESRKGCFFMRAADRSALSLPGTTCASGPTQGSIGYCDSATDRAIALCGPASVLLLKSDSGPNIAFRLHDIFLGGFGTFVHDIYSLSSDTECLVSDHNGDCSAGWTYIVARPLQTSVACTLGDTNLALMTCGREAGIFKQDCCPADSLPEDVPITGAVESVPIESPLPTSAPMSLPPTTTATMEPASIPTPAPSPTTGVPSDITTVDSTGRPVTTTDAPVPVMGTIDPTMATMTDAPTPAGTEAPIASAPTSAPSSPTSPTLTITDTTDSPTSGSYLYVNTFWKLATIVAVFQLLWSSM